MLQEEEYEESTVPSATWGVGELKEERIQKCRLLLKKYNAIHSSSAFYVLIVIIIFLS